MELNNQKLVVVSPHPDDLEIAMGGTVAKAISQGAEVISIVLTDGRRSPRIVPCSDADMAATRKQEVLAAAQVLQLTAVHCLDWEDLRLPAQRQAAQQEMLRLLSEVGPTEIYLPHPSLDRHETHRLGAQLTLAALEDLTQIVKPALWAYEVWGLFPYWQQVVDISDFVPQKQAAIACHQSQTSVMDYAAGILGLNRWRAVFEDPHNLPKAEFVEVFINLAC